MSGANQMLIFYLSIQKRITRICSHVFSSAQGKPPREVMSLSSHAVTKQPLTVLRMNEVTRMGKKGLLHDTAMGPECLLIQPNPVLTGKVLGHIASLRSLLGRSW